VKIQVAVLCIGVVCILYPFQMIRQRTDHTPHSRLRCLQLLVCHDACHTEPLYFCLPPGAKQADVEPSIDDEPMCAHVVGIQSSHKAQIKETQMDDDMPSGPSDELSRSMRGEQDDCYPLALTPLESMHVFHSE
jgi:hypothetical protein